MTVEDLERELRAERPELDSEFARELDDWAAQGFPCDRGLGPRAGSATDPLERLRSAWDRIRAVPPRRVLLPAGALATVAVIGAVAVGQFGETDGVTTTENSTSLEDGGSLGGGSDGDAGAAAAAPEVAQPEAAPGTASEFEAAPAEDAARSTAEAFPPPEDFTPDGGSGGGIARGTEDRIIDATARLTLGAEAQDVQGVANDVVEVADSHDGIVLDSQVTTDQGGARAAFEIEVPYTELDATLEDLSGLADVISRTEAGEDITSKAVRARRERANLLEQVSEARVELAEADTRRERLAIKAQIRSLEAQADAFDEQVNTVKRQGRMATLDVEITSGSSSSSGDWSISDAAEDAGRTLEVIVGIALVALAVLLPVTLVAAIAWWLAARGQRARRERALDA